METGDGILGWLWWSGQARSGVCEMGWWFDGLLKIIMCFPAPTSTLYLTISLQSILVISFTQVPSYLTHKFIYRRRLPALERSVVPALVGLLSDHVERQGHLMLSVQTPMAAHILYSSELAHKIEDPISQDAIRVFSTAKLGMTATDV